MNIYFIELLDGIFSFLKFDDLLIKIEKDSEYTQINFYYQGLKLAHCFVKIKNWSNINKLVTDIYNELYNKYQIDMVKIISLASRY